MLRKTFYIQVYRDGRRIPLIHIHPTEYEHLGDLSQGHLNKSKAVAQELEQIRKVMNDEKELYAFGGSDWCILDVKKEETFVTNSFDAFESFSVPTLEIIKLMEEWHDFLKAYENGEIPGLC